VSHETSASVGDLTPGARLADYEVQEKIGRGGMAAVYRALDLGLGRLVALKVLAPDLAEDDIFRQRFIRESRAAAGVEHPHIIPVFDAGEADGLLYIAMRYVERGDMRRLLDSEGPLSPARASSITMQVASALDAAHAHGLIHRDVKPGNILLGDTNGSASDYVYLSDFGLSKHSVNTSTLTATGQFFGTLDYVAPEQIQGQPVDGRADQYGLACTVVEMLAGSPPFKRDRTVELMWAQLEAPPPWLSERRPDLPLALDAVIRTALAKSPNDRFATCGEFATALRSACEVKAAPAGHAPGGHAPPGHAPPGHAPPGHAPPGHAPGVYPQASPTFDPAPGPARAWQAPATRKDAIIEGTRRPEAGHSAPATRHRGNRRQRSAWLIAVMALIGVAVVAVVGYTLFVHQPGPGAAGKATPVAHYASPEATVRAYVRDINRKHYYRAWQLLGNTGDTRNFAQFKAGFSGTRRDKLHIVSVNGEVVTIELRAYQTDGSVKAYAGTYKVVDGIIAVARIEPVSPVAGPA
jgi:hypothetical protein